MLSADCQDKAGVLIFSCAGGANVGQLSNAAAVRLDQEGLGIVFCLAGVGGHVEGIVQKTKEAGCTVVIDGCQMGCAKETLDHIGVAPNCYLVVTELGIEKNRDLELCEEEVQRVVEAVKSECECANEGSGAEGCSCCSDE